MHPESEHGLMVEVARLQQDLREARAQIGKEREAWVAVNARADAANSKLAATDVERLQALSALAAARRECHEQCEAKEAAYSHIYKLRDALERCSELFSTIRGDWTDPRSECREGQDVIRAALAAPAAAAGEEKP